MKMSIILPYTTYKGWVSNANKICEFVVAKGAHESNGMIRHNGSMTDSYLFRKFVAEGDMNGAINNRERYAYQFPNYSICRCITNACRMLQRNQSTR